MDEPPYQIAVFYAWLVLQGTRCVHPEGPEELDRIPHVLRTKPPETTMLSRPLRDFATPQSNCSPVPPLTFALCASSKNRSGSYSSNASREAALSTRSAFITLTPASLMAVTVS